MLIKQHMSTPPVTIRADADYQSALALMQEHGVHHVPVLDGDGRLAGILAERDLLLAASHFLQSHVEVGEVMHRGVVTVTPDTPLEHGAALLARHKIGSLPVVDAGGKVVGVITETDMLLALVDALAGPARSARASVRAPAKRAASGGAGTKARLPAKTAARPTRSKAAGRAR